MNNEFIKVYNLLKNDFAEASTQENRRKRDKLNPVTGEFDWVTYERNMMYLSTNTYRKQRKLPPISLEQIKIAENSAKGHIDYYNKFPLYCTELVFKK